MLLLVGGLAGCGDTEHGPYPMEPGRQRARPDREVIEPAPAHARLPVLDAQGRPVLLYDLPAGWVELPPSPMRSISIRIPGSAGVPDGDLSVSWAGGDVAGNVNRWLRQFGLEALDDAGLQALAMVMLLNSPGVRVEARGTYDAGMGGSAPKEGQALLGIVSAANANPRLFVKLIGPEALVRAQRPAFAAFVASLYRAGSMPPASAPGPTPPEQVPGTPPPETVLGPPPAPGPPPSGTTPAPVAPPAASGFDPSKLTWDVPSGWKAVKPRSMMRLSDFVIEGAPGTQAVLSHLARDGGGVSLNVNRWRGQMGATELSEAEIAALERLDVLGVKAVWVEIEGGYKGMAGEDIPGALFVGVLCLLPDDALFFRLVGPKAEVEPQREALRALLRTLRTGA